MKKFINSETFNRLLIMVLSIILGSLVTYAVMSWCVVDPMIGDLERYEDLEFYANECMNWLDEYEIGDEKEEVVNGLHDSDAYYRYEKTRCEILRLRYN